MSGFYTYKVKWYDDFDNAVQTAQGITYGTFYSDALNSITDYYGENTIVEVTLQAMEPASCLELSTEEVFRLEHA